MTIHFDRIFFTKLTSFTFHKIVKIVTFHFDEILEVLMNFVDLSEKLVLAKVLILLEAAIFLVHPPEKETSF